MDILSSVLIQVFDWMKKGSSTKCFLSPLVFEIISLIKSQIPFLLFAVPIQHFSTSCTHLLSGAWWPPCRRGRYSPQHCRRSHRLGRLRRTGVRVAPGGAAPPPQSWSWQAVDCCFPSTEGNAGAVERSNGHYHHTGLSISFGSATLLDKTQWITHDSGNMWCSLWINNYFY